MASPANLQRHVFLERNECGRMHEESRVRANLLIGKNWMERESYFEAHRTAMKAMRCDEDGSGGRI
jgi:hypothetical protein